MCKMASKMNIHGPACSRNEQGATVMFGFLIRLNARPAITPCDSGKAATVMFGFLIRLNRFRFEGFGHALCVGEAKGLRTPYSVAFKATASP